MLCSVGRIETRILGMMDMFSGKTPPAGPEVIKERKKLLKNAAPKLTALISDESLNWWWLVAV